MSKFEKVLAKVLSGGSDRNIGFDDLCGLLEKYGFESRTRGSHHIFFKSGIEEIINLQPKGTHAKPYQVKQVRDLVVRYKLNVTQ
jgi:predicted RNA binding protein YcfA (HicA-like mRNA interferase family)